MCDQALSLDNLVKPRRTTVIKSGAPDKGVTFALPEALQLEPGIIGTRVEGFRIPDTYSEVVADRKSVVTSGIRPLTLIMVNSRSHIRYE